MDKIFAILTKFIPGFGALGIFNKASGIIAAALAIWWMLGNRDTQVCLSYLELAGVIFVGTIGLEMNRKSEPGL